MSELRRRLFSDHGFTWPSTPPSRGPQSAMCGGCSREWILDIEDVSGFVAGQRGHIDADAELSVLAEDLEPIIAVETRCSLGSNSAPTNAGSL